MKRVAVLRSVVAAALLCLAPVAAQELDPRSYAPAPIDTSFVLFSLGRNDGDIVLDSSSGIDDIDADLTVSTVAYGPTFGRAGKQARVMAVLPPTTGDISADVGGVHRTQELRGIGDPRVKRFLWLRGAPALTLEELATAPKRTVVGSSLAVVAPLGDYSSSSSSTSATTAGR